MNAVELYFNKTVLKALDSTTPKNGNAIQAAIRKYRGTNLGPGILRPTLNELIQSGLVAEPAHNTYTITKDGIEWMESNTPIIDTHS